MELLRTQSYVPLRCDTNSSSSGFISQIGRDDPAPAPSLVQERENLVGHLPEYPINDVLLAHVAVHNVGVVYDIPLLRGLAAEKIGQLKAGPRAWENPRWKMEGFMDVVDKAFQQPQEFSGILREEIVQYAMRNRSQMVGQGVLGRGVNSNVQRDFYVGLINILEKRLWLAEERDRFEGW